MKLIFYNNDKLKYKIVTQFYLTGMQVLNLRNIIHHINQEASYAAYKHSHLFIYNTQDIEILNHTNLQSI
jgi:hypothetical protein